MIAARPIAGRTLGLTADDLRGKPYARFWSPTMAPLASHARDALARGAVAPALLPPLADARHLFEPVRDTVEDGVALASSGAVHIAIRTAMPGVTPAMVDWWFGWHSDEPQRYKLWHPRAHVHAMWTTPPPRATRGRERYVGRVSIVDEFLGSTLGRFAIRFVEPGVLGLDHASLRDPERATAVCARVGLGDHPIDAGVLVHHVRRTPEGSEMRSRFWLGGPDAAARVGGALGNLGVRLLQPLVHPTLQDGLDLLVHCSEEMTHLAEFLPGLHAELGRG